MPKTNKPDMDSALDIHIRRFTSSPIHNHTLKTLKFARGAYRCAVGLSVVAFLVGASLLVTPIVLSFVRDDVEQLAIILGAVGTLDLIALLLYHPIDRIQSGASRLLQLQASWFTFYAQWDSAARALSTLSELPMDEKRWNMAEGYQREMAISQRLGNLASRVMVDFNPIGVSNLITEQEVDEDREYSAN